MARPGQALHTITTEYSLDQVLAWVRQDIALTRLVREEWDSNPAPLRRSPQRKGMSRSIWAHGGVLAKASGIANPTYEQCWDALLCVALGISAVRLASWKRGD